MNMSRTRPLHTEYADGCGEAGAMPMSYDRGPRGAMPRWPSASENRIGRAGAVRLSLGSGAEGLAEHGHRTHRNTTPPFLQLRKRRPGAALN